MIGKTSSIKKENRSNQKIGAVGFDRIEFYHKASSGDTIIDLGALITPTIELAGSGFSQPSPSDLLASGIKAKQNSFKLINSQGLELMNRVAYTIVDNSTIRLVDAALEGEIFHGVIDGSVKNLIQLPETQTIVATGLLEEGITNFAVGASFRTEVNPLTQLGEILVYRNGILMLRNVSNAVADGEADGNYEEIPIGNGFSNEIKFNIAGDVDGEAIHIISPTRIIKDDGTLLQQVQTLQGVIDIMRDDLVNEFQFPSTRYNGFASDVDLKAFNNRVLTLEDILNVDVPIKTTTTVTTPTVKGATTDPVLGTLTESVLSYHREGEFLLGYVAIVQSSSGTEGVGGYYIGLPAGLVLDRTTISTVGEAFIEVNGVRYAGPCFMQSGFEGISCTVGNATASFGGWNAVSHPVATGTYIVRLNFKVKIVGWDVSKKIIDLI